MSLSSGLFLGTRNKIRAEDMGALQHDVIGMGDVHFAHDGYEKMASVIHSSVSSYNKVTVVFALQE